MAMTYEKIFGEIKKHFEKAKTGNFTESFAFQFNIVGEGEGIFYAAYKDGILSVEPYDYKDRDVIFEADGKTLIAIASGKTEPIDAIKAGKLAIDGNHELAKQLMFLADTSTAPDKAAQKAKPAAKKPAKTETKPAPKAPAKPTVKPAAKPETKSAVKAAPEVKTASQPAKKAEAKPAPKTAAKTATKTKK